MAVYTPLSESDLHAVLAQYDCGRYVSHTGITSGIENTNYFVHTLHAGTPRKWVLTVFERLSFAQLPYYLELTAHLAALGLPVSAPNRSLAGQLMITVQGKPAALAVCLPGGDVAQTTLQHCAAVGHLLAKMHNATPSFAMRQPNMRGLDWWQATVPTLYAHLAPEQAALLADELAVQSAYAQTAAYAALPRGAVHADLFCDNVLFAPDGTAGAIDFYFAGDDTYVFDFCVTVNDWCIDRNAKGISEGNLNLEKLQSFAAAYTAQRPMAAAELAALPTIARAAALRFWVSRLNDWFKPRAASQLVALDPTHFERVLRSRRDFPLSAMTLSAMNLGAL